MTHDETEAALARRCLRCNEPILPDEKHDETTYIDEHGQALLSSLHRECAIRSIVGSLGHQLGMCSCHGGTFEDPQELTKRQAAIAAARLAQLWRG